MIQNAMSSLMQGLTANRPEVFSSLWGVEAPTFGIHDNIVVDGLSIQGSGREWNFVQMSAADDDAASGVPNRYDSTPVDHARPLAPVRCHPLVLQYMSLLRDPRVKLKYIPTLLDMMLHDEELFSQVDTTPSVQFAEYRLDAIARWWMIGARAILTYENSKGRPLGKLLGGYHGAVGGRQSVEVCTGSCSSSGSSGAGTENEEEAGRAARRCAAALDQTSLSDARLPLEEGWGSSPNLIEIMAACWRQYRKVVQQIAAELRQRDGAAAVAEEDDEEERREHQQPGVGEDSTTVSSGVTETFTLPPLRLPLQPSAVHGIVNSGGHHRHHGSGTNDLGGIGHLGDAQTEQQRYIDMFEEAVQRNTQTLSSYSVTPPGRLTNSQLYVHTATTTGPGPDNGGPSPASASSSSSSSASAFNMDHSARLCLESMQECSDAGHVELLLWWARCRILAYRMLDEGSRSTVVSTNAVDFFRSLWQSTSLAREILEDDAEDIVRRAAVVARKERSSPCTTSLSSPSSSSSLPLHQTSKLDALTREAERLYASLVGTIADISKLWITLAIVDSNSTAIVETPDTNPVWGAVNSAVPPRRRFRRESFYCFADYWQYALLIDDFATQSVKFSIANRGRVIVTQLLQVLEQYPGFYPALLMRTIGILNNRSMISANLNDRFIMAVIRCLHYYLPEMPPVPPLRTTEEAIPAADGAAEMGGGTAIGGDSAAESGASTVASPTATTDFNSFISRRAMSDEERLQEMKDLYHSMPRLSVKAYEVLLICFYVLSSQVRLFHGSANPLAFLCTTPSSFDSRNTAGTEPGAWMEQRDTLDTNRTAATGAPTTTAGNEGPSSTAASPPSTDTTDLYSQLHRLVRQTRYGSLAAAALNFLSVCVHFNVRDMVPLFIEKGLLNTAIELAKRPRHVCFSSSSYADTIPETWLHDAEASTTLYSVCNGEDVDGCGTAEWQRSIAASTARKRSVTADAMPLRSQQLYIVEEEERINDVAVRLALPSFVEAMAVHQSTHSIFAANGACVSAAVDSLGLLYTRRARELMTFLVESAYSSGSGGSGGSPPSSKRLRDRLKAGEVVPGARERCSWRTDRDAVFKTLVDRIEQTGHFEEPVPLSSSSTALSLTHPIIMRLMGLCQIRLSQDAIVKKARTVAFRDSVQVVHNTLKHRSVVYFYERLRASLTTLLAATQEIVERVRAVASAIEQSGEASSAALQLRQVAALVEVEAAAQSVNDYFLMLSLLDLDPLWQPNPVEGDGTASTMSIAEQCKACLTLFSQAVSQLWSLQTFSPPAPSDPTSGAEGSTAAARGHAPLEAAEARCSAIFIGMVQMLLGQLLNTRSFADFLRTVPRTLTTELCESMETVARSIVKPAPRAPSSTTHAAEEARAVHVPPAGQAVFLQQLMDACRTAIFSAPVSMGSAASPSHRNAGASSWRDLWKTLFHVTVDALVVKMPCDLAGAWTLLHAMRRATLTNSSGVFPLIPFASLSSNSADTDSRMAEEASTPSSTAASAVAGRLSPDEIILQYVFDDELECILSKEVAWMSRSSWRHLCSDATASSSPSAEVSCGAVPSTTTRDRSASPTPPPRDDRIATGTTFPSRSAATSTPTAETAAAPGADGVPDGLREDSTRPSSVTPDEDQRTAVSTPVPTATVFATASLEAPHYAASHPVMVIQVWLLFTILMYRSSNLHRARSVYTTSWRIGNNPRHRLMLDYFDTQDRIYVGLNTFAAGYASLIQLQDASPDAGNEDNAPRAAASAQAASSSSPPTITGAEVPREKQRQRQRALCRTPSPLTAMDLFTVPLKPVDEVALLEAIDIDVLRRLLCRFVMVQAVMNPFISEPNSTDLSLSSFPTMCVSFMRAVILLSRVLFSTTHAGGGAATAAASSSLSADPPQPWRTTEAAAGLQQPMVDGTASPTRLPPALAKKKAMIRQYFTFFVVSLFSSIRHCSNSLAQHQPLIAVMIFFVMEVLPTLDDFPLQPQLYLAMMDIVNRFPQEAYYDIEVPSRTPDWMRRFGSKKLRRTDNGAARQARRPPADEEKPVQHPSSEAASLPQFLRSSANSLRFDSILYRIAPGRLAAPQEAGAEAMTATEVPPNAADPHLQHNLLRYVCDLCCSCVLPLEALSSIGYDHLRRRTCQFLWTLSTAGESAPLIAYLIDRVLSNPRRYVVLLEYVGVLLTQQNSMMVVEAFALTPLPAAVLNAVRGAVEMVRAEESAWVAAQAALTQPSSTSAASATAAAAVVQRRRRQLFGPQYCKLYGQLFNFLSVFQHISWDAPIVADRFAALRKTDRYSLSYPQRQHLRMTAVKCSFFNAGPTSFCWHGHRCPRLHVMPSNLSKSGRRRVGGEKDDKENSNTSSLSWSAQLEVDQMLQVLDLHGYRSPLAATPLSVTKPARRTSAASRAAAGPNQHNRQSAGYPFAVESSQSTAHTPNDEVGDYALRPTELISHVIRDPVDHYADHPENSLHTILPYSTLLSEKLCIEVLHLMVEFMTFDIDWRLEDDSSPYAEPRRMSGSSSEKSSAPLAKSAVILPRLEIVECSIERVVVLLLLQLLCSKYHFCLMLLQQPLPLHRRPSTAMPGSSLPSLARKEEEMLWPLGSRHPTALSSSHSGRQWTAFEVVSAYATKSVSQQEEQTLLLCQLLLTDMHQVEREVVVALRETWRKSVCVHGTAALVDPSSYTAICADHQRRREKETAERRWPLGHCSSSSLPVTSRAERRGTEGARRGRINTADGSKDLQPVLSSVHVDPNHRGGDAEAPTSGGKAVVLSDYTVPLPIVLASLHQFIAHHPVAFSHVFSKYCEVRWVRDGAKEGATPNLWLGVWASPHAFADHPKSSGPNALSIERKVAARVEVYLRWLLTNITRGYTSRGEAALHLAALSQLSQVTAALLSPSCVIPPPPAYEKVLQLAVAHPQQQHQVVVATKTEDGAGQSDYSRGPAEEGIQKDPLPGEANAAPSTTLRLSPSPLPYPYPCGTGGSPLMLSVATQTSPSTTMTQCNVCPVSSFIAMVLYFNTDDLHITYPFELLATIFARAPTKCIDTILRLLQSLTAQYEAAGGRPSDRGTPTSPPPAMRQDHAECEVEGGETLPVAPTTSSSLDTSISPLTADQQLQEQERRLHCIYALLHMIDKGCPRPERAHVAGSNGGHVNIARQSFVQLYDYLYYNGFLDLLFTIIRVCPCSSTKDTDALLRLLHQQLRVCGETTLANQLSPHQLETLRRSTEAELPVMIPRRVEGEGAGVARLAPSSHASRLNMNGSSEWYYPDAGSMALQWQLLPSPNQEVLVLVGGDASLMPRDTAAQDIAYPWNYIGTSTTPAIQVADPDPGYGVEGLELEEAEEEEEIENEDDMVEDEDGDDDYQEYNLSDQMLRVMPFSPPSSFFDNEAYRSWRPGPDARQTALGAHTGSPALDEWEEEASENEDDHGEEEVREVEDLFEEDEEEEVSYGGDGDHVDAEHAQYMRYAIAARTPQPEPYTPSIYVFNNGVLQSWESRPEATQAALGAHTGSPALDEWEEEASENEDGHGEEEEVIQEEAEEHEEEGIVFHLRPRGSPRLLMEADEEGTEESEELEETEEAEEEEEAEEAEVEDESSHTDASYTSGGFPLQRVAPVHLQGFPQARPPVRNFAVHISGDHPERASSFEVSLYRSILYGIGAISASNAIAATTPALPRLSAEEVVLPTTPVLTEVEVYPCTYTPRGDTDADEHDQPPSLLASLREERSGAVADTTDAPLVSPSSSPASSAPPAMPLSTWMLAALEDRGHSPEDRTPSAELIHQQPQRRSSSTSESGHRTTATATVTAAMLNDLTAQVLTFFESMAPAHPVISDPSSAISESSALQHDEREAELAEEQPLSSNSQEFSDTTGAANTTITTTAAAAPPAEGAEAPSEREPWEGVLDPLFLAAVPLSLASQAIFENMHLLRGTEEHEVLGQRTHLLRSFLDQLPAEMHQHLLEAESRWSRVTGVDNSAAELYAVIIMADDETRRDLLMQCDLTQLQGYPSILREAIELRERAERVERSQQELERQRQQTVDTRITAADIEFIPVQRRLTSRRRDMVDQGQDTSVHRNDDVVPEGEPAAMQTRTTDSTVPHLFFTANTTEEEMMASMLGEVSLLYRIIRYELSNARYRHLLDNIPEAAPTAAAPSPELSNTAWMNAMHRLRHTMGVGDRGGDARGSGGALGNLSNSNHSQLHVPPNLDRGPRCRTTGRATGPSAPYPVILSTLESVVPTQSSPYHSVCLPLPVVPRDVLRRCFQMLFITRTASKSTNTLASYPTANSILGPQLDMLLQLLSGDVLSAGRLIAQLLDMLLEVPTMDAHLPSSPDGPSRSEGGEPAAAVIRASPICSFDMSSSAVHLRTSAYGAAPPADEMLQNQSFVLAAMHLLHHWVTHSRSAALAFFLLPDGVLSHDGVKSTDVPLDAAEQELASLGLWKRLLQVALRHSQVLDFTSALHQLLTHLLKAMNSITASADRDERSSAANQSDPHEQEELSEELIEYPRHCHRLHWENIRVIPSYESGGYCCNVCAANGGDDYCFHCKLCHYDICPACSRERLTAADQVLRLRRSAYYMLLAVPETISIMAAYLRYPLCCPPAASCIIAVLSRGLRECCSRDAPIVFGGGHGGATPNPVLLLERQLTEVAHLRVQAIKTARDAFRREVGVVVESYLQRKMQAPLLMSGLPSTLPSLPEKSATAASAPTPSTATPAVSWTGMQVLQIPDQLQFDTITAMSLLQRLDLKESVSEAVQLLFEPYADTNRVEPHVISLLWRASQAYLRDVSLLLEHLRPQEIVPLPPCVSSVMKTFCKYHLHQSRRNGMSASATTLGNSIGSFTNETEHFLRAAIKPSTVSDRARKELAAQPNAATSTTAFGTHLSDEQTAGELEEHRRLPRAVRAFIEENRATLNMMLHWDAMLLQDTFDFLKYEPNLIDFNFKLKDFRRRMNVRRGHTITLRVSRENCLRDSFNELKKVKSFTGMLHIRFSGEEGADAGGLTREWLQLLSEALVNESYALFIHSHDSMSFQPNPFSDVNPNHLAYFRFAGTVVALAIVHNVPIDIHFTRAFYRHIIGHRPVFTDLQSFDPELYTNLNWMRENDVTDLGLTFAVNYDRFGSLEEAELEANGRSIAVTNENKQQYIRLLCEFYLTRRMEEQLVDFLKGFYAVIPRHEIQCFTENELELVISGVPDIDVEDLRSNTVYEGYTASSPQVRWFWEAVGSMNKEDLANLLQFAMGSSKVPYGGFAHLVSSSGQSQPFTISRWAGNRADLLPQAHTCFNKIDLPVYPSAEVLREKLMVAITFGSMGFTMV